MLTARGEKLTELLVSKSGADDYVVKPFSIRELILRMRAILRRGSSEPEPDSEETLEFGVLKLILVLTDLDSREEIKLTVLEGFASSEHFYSERASSNERDTSP